MRTVLILSLLLCRSLFGGTPQAEVKDFSVTKGSIIFDGSGVTFHARGKEEHFMSKLKVGDVSIPGLQAAAFREVHELEPGGAKKDVSILTLSGEDGRDFD